MTKDSNSKWDKHYNNAGRASVLSNLVYYEQEHVEKFNELAKDVPDGFELLIMTDQLTDTTEASLRCIVFINHDTKEILFATAGTRPGTDQRTLDDLKDDLDLVEGKMPQKMKPAGALNSMILENLGEEAAEYKFHYTGHSLGAAMAEMQAADMDIKLRKKGMRKNDPSQISAVTFENPGTKPIIKEMYKQAGQNPELMGELNFTTFNNRKNFINSLNEQAGTTYEIVPHGQKERNPTTAEMFCAHIAKELKTVSKWLSIIFEILSYDAISVVNEHSITVFLDVMVDGKGDLKESGKTETVRGVLEETQHNKEKDSTDTLPSTTLTDTTTKGLKEQSQERRT